MKPPARTFIFLFLAVLLLTTACTAEPERGGYQVIAHPDGPLHAGDRVSFEVIAPGSDSQNQLVEVRQGDESLGLATVTAFGLGRRSQATLWWIWDTASLEAGRHMLTFSVADGPTWDEILTLHPAEQVPPPEPEATWATAATDCCNIFYITGTAAEEDIEFLSTTADEQARAVSVQMGTALEEKIGLVFMPRVIGHGGFAWDAVYISYLDGNYVGNEMDIVLHHEFVHYFDGWIGGDYRPAILQEGLATYLSGGHFKPEPIGARAAALLDLGWYIPLATLADDFYRQQHEIGYLEAAALVQYLTVTYGEGAFNEFYRTMPYPDMQTDSQVLDAAFRDSFNISLEGLEEAFLEYLRTQAVPDEVRTDLELTVANFDTIRRYQAAFDPSAYFLYAWLPDGKVMRQEGFVADLTRRPRGWQNRLVERLLVEVHADLFNGEYEATRRSLAWTNWMLDILVP